jgi:hypothetical protein
MIMKAQLRNMRLGYLGPLAGDRVREVKKPFMKE